LGFPVTAIELLLQHLDEGFAKAETCAAHGRDGCSTSGHNPVAFLTMPFSHWVFAYEVLMHPDETIVFSHSCYQTMSCSV
jgi:hypothetical protein